MVLFWRLRGVRKVTTGGPRAPPRRLLILGQNGLIFLEVSEKLPYGARPNFCWFVLTLLTRPVAHAAIAKNRHRAKAAPVHVFSHGGGAAVSEVFGKRPPINRSADLDDASGWVS